MAEWVVLNNDESVDYTDTLPDPLSFAYAVHRSTTNVIKPNSITGPITFSTTGPTASLQASDGQSLNTDISRPSSSGVNVMTPTRLESRPMMNIGHFSDPSRLGAPFTTPMRQESRPFPSTVCFYKSARPGAPRVPPRPLDPRGVLLGTPRFGPPLPAPPHPDTPGLKINVIAESSIPATQTRYIPPYAQLNTDFGKEGRWSTSNTNTTITSTSVRKDTSHPNQAQHDANIGGLVATALHEKVRASKITNNVPTLANQAASVACGSTVTGEKLVSKAPKVGTAVANPEDLSGPTLAASTQKTTAPKMVKVPSKASGGGSGAPARTPSTKNSAVSKATKITIVDVVGGSSDSVRVPVMTNTAANAVKVSTTLANGKSSETASRLSSTTNKNAAKTTKGSIGLTDKEVPGAVTNAPSSKKVAGPKSQMAEMSLADQEKFGPSVALADAQDRAPSKALDNPPSRKTLTATKPKATKPKTVKSVAQDADTVEPKTPKRRPSSSHPNARNPKIAKKTTPPNQSTPAETQKTPIREISRAITLGTPKERGTPKKQSITRWTHHSAASDERVSLGGDRVTTRPSIVLEVASPLARKASRQVALPNVASSIVPEVASPLARKAPQQIAIQNAASILPEVASPLVRKASQQVAVQKAALAEVRDYPNFRDGDVLIISPIDNKTWTLHSTILCSASPVLKNIISKQDPLHIKKREREDGMTVKWKLIMIGEPDAKHNDPEGLNFKSFKAVGVLDKKASLSQFDMPLNVNGLDAQPQFNKLYDNFFKCLYNIAPAFASKPDDPESREYILDAHKLVEAATFLDAVAAVRAPVEAKLLRLNAVLWTYLESRPESWVHLAARLQSPLMFSEAIIHIVGKFDLRGGIDEDLLIDKEGRHGELGRQIWDLIVKKARELKDKKLRIERRLLEYYPTRMLHEETDDSIPGRAIYSEDIYFWQALTLVRQFVASAYMANFHHRGSDAGIKFYRDLFACTYLRPETLGGFYECFPMTPKGKQRLMQVLEMIKADLKPIVQELLVNSSMGDRGPNAPALNHLTCVEVLEEELPWVIPTAQTDGDVEMSGAL